MASHRILVTLPPEIVAGIDRIAGPRKRSQFLSELARREIKRQRLLRLFEDPQPIWKDEDHPELAAGASKWVRRMRTEGEARIPVANRRRG